MKHLRVNKHLRENKEADAIVTPASASHRIIDSYHVFLSYNFPRLCLQAIIFILPFLLTPSHSAHFFHSVPYPADFSFPHAPRA